VPDDEMLRAFNMGIGMIVAADERDATTALDLIREHGGDGAVIIGRIAEGQRGVAYL
jgi:phosphoribosylaminoimidazole (AIR) synthetase